MRISNLQILFGRININSNKKMKEYMRMDTHLLHSSQWDSYNKRDCSACPIRHNAICSRCQPDELDALDQMKTYRIFEKGEAITHIGENIAYVGTIVSGVATISKSLEDGRKQILGILLPSDFVGRPGHPVSSYDVVAETPVEMCRFPIVSFEKLLNQSPALGPRLLEKTFDELDTAREWMLLLGRKTAREKLATFLHMLAIRMTRLHAMPIVADIQLELPLTRKILSDYLGLTMETVSRQLSRLSKDGIISIKGQRQITIHHMTDLFAETSGERSG
jgi:CRP/FNR family transcriptional regulator